MNCFYTMNINSLFDLNKLICKSASVGHPKTSGNWHLVMLGFQFPFPREHCIVNYILHCLVKTRNNKLCYLHYHVPSIACCVMALVFHAVASNYI